MHEAQDEVFHVLDGRFRFRIGDELIEAHPGDVLFGPRGVPHAFASVSPTARLLLTFQPALTIEAFFTEGGLDPLSEEFARVSRAHGMELIAPPLELDEVRTPAGARAPAEPLGEARARWLVRPRDCETRARSSAPHS